MWGVRLKNKMLYAFIKGEDIEKTTDQGNIEIIGNKKVIIENGNIIIDTNGTNTKLNTILNKFI